MTDQQKPTPDAAVEALGTLAAAATELERQQDALALMEPDAQADAVAVLQDLKFRLGQIETQAATNLGKIAGAIQGNLSDGRQFTLKRAADRKEWDHDEWKRDARRNIVKHTTDEMGSVIQVLTEDGEVQEFNLAALLHSAITEAQEVHGSTAPRSTALKRLGLYASDYCTTTPGGWRFTALRPEPKPETTTTQED